MIILQEITLQMGARVLLNKANFSIYKGQKIGLIGRNGCGKTSLFGLIEGLHPPQHGEMIRQAGCRLAHLKQETPGLTESVLDYVVAGDEEAFSLSQKLAQAEAQEDYNKLAEYHAKMADLDMYTLPSRAAELLHGLGFHSDDMNKSVAAFSGGWRMRANLARLLLSRADLLLLDEPTNHLDFESIVWLEKWLVKMPAALLIISHDRDFLDATVSHIAHIEAAQLKLYGGDYSTFEKTYAEERALQQSLYKKQQARSAELTQFINRFKAKASKAKQAQSRMKMLERMEAVPPLVDSETFQLTFRPALMQQNPMLVLESASVQYQERMVLRDVNFSIPAEARIGILGENGAGKSTLLKAIAGRLQLTHGVYQAASKLRIGYFAQHQVDELILEQSPLQHLQLLDKKASEQSLRNFLGGFGFSSEQALSPIVNFSGGEKARLAFSLLIWQQPDLLLLDEPTNHLDMDMRFALIQALQNYNGAMLIVSHDRYLLRACVDELWCIKNGKLDRFDGDLEDYRDSVWREKQMMVSHRKQKKSSPGQVEKEKKRLLSRLKSIEELQASLIKERADYDKLLSDDALYVDARQKELDDLLARSKSNQAKQEKLDEEWLELSEKLESISNAE